MDAWIEDLEFMLEKIEEIHPNPYHENSREVWEQVISETKDQLVKLADPLKITQYYKIIALLADSHSRINLRFGESHSDMEIYLPEEYNGQYPLSCQVFADGIFVTKAAQTDLLGKEVVTVNKRPIKQVAASLRPYLPVENEIGYIAYFPYFLRLPLFLVVIGLISDPRDGIDIGFSDGSTVQLYPSKDELVDILDTVDYAVPHYLRPERKLSLRQEKDSLILDIREIQDSEELSLRELSDLLDEKLTELSKLPDYGGINRLIIDLRENGGGNNYLTQPIIRTVIRHPRIDYPGRLFVCINRWTFSAAINTANYLENYTWALFAGEPFSGRVNHYGDSEKIILPHSQLEVRISSLYWQDSDPNDTRHSIIPDIPLQLTFAQYLSDEDLLLKKIEEFEVDEDWIEFYKSYPPRAKRHRQNQQDRINTFLS